mgnify:CR=1 FL=1
MKKTLSILLAVVLLLSLSVNALAAEMTPTANKNTLSAGEEVVVTISLDEDIKDIVTLNYKLYFDDSVFELTKTEQVNPSINVAAGKDTDKDGTFYNISCMDVLSEGITIARGDLCRLTFRAKTDLTENKESSFRLVFDNAMDNKFNSNIVHTAGEAAKVSVSPAGEVLTLYGRIYGKSVNSEFADLTGSVGSNGVEYVCKDIEKKTGLDVIKGVLEASGYTYVATETAITSITDPSGVTLANGDAAYGPKSVWVATINGEKPATTLAGYVVDNESTGFDGDEFVLTFTECPGSTDGKHNFKNGVCSVCGMKKETGSYTLTLPADKTVNAGEASAIPVTLGHTGDETTFHAADMVFTYDAGKLEYTGISDTTNYIVDAATAGKVHVQAYGEAKNLGEAFTLNFKVKTTATGTATVAVTSAKIDKSANAVAKDAPEAKLLDAETVLTIKATHSVTLPNIFEGETTVEDGAGYTFSKTDKDESHYEYTNVKAMVDGKDVEVVDNGDGTYTVKNVTGDLTVTGKRTAKTYSVKVEGTGAEDVTAASSAIYGENFKFTLDRKAGFRYTVAVKVGDKSVTPDTTDNLSYTIPGADVTGNIVITVTKDAIQVEKTTVNFEGSGAGDVNGGTSQDTPTGADFTFTVNEDAKYNYTVKLGDEVLTGTNGSYTIPGAKVVSGTITVTVEKTVSTQGVKVQKYVKLENQQSVWLVTVEADPGANNVYTYGGERMFKTTKYGTNGTYAYLVIAPTLSVEDAAAQLSITAGEAAGTVSYGGDVNGSGVVDINDAQLVYDMYNAHYASFSDVAMYKFLCADIADDTPEGSTLLNVSDAVAVISKINQQ